MGSTHDSWSNFQVTSSLRFTLSMCLAITVGACTSADPPEAARISAETVAQTTLSDANELAIANGEHAIPRVLLIGDSTLLAVKFYGLQANLVGFDSLLDVASCRTLGVRSCGPTPKPMNAVEAITAAVGDFDIVVVMAGYDEWWTTFPSSFDKVMTAARAINTKKVLWMNYRVGTVNAATGPMAIDDSYTRNNRHLLEAVESGRFPELVVADWNEYSRTSKRLLEGDEVHLTMLGAAAVADYISRYIAHLSGLPCPPATKPASDLPQDPCPIPI